MKIIDEVKELTAVAVSKKQDAAKLNYTKIISQVKLAAERGESECRIDSTQMNEYDRQLLQKDGFSVNLVDKPYQNRDDFYKIAQFISSKEWVIKW